MKKCTLFLFLLCLCTGLSAQYKKASFFEKTGRTYGISTKLYAFGDGKGSPLGFTLSFGKDQENRRLFTFWDLSYIPGYSFTLKTSDVNGSPVTVTGKSKFQIVYAYNWGYHLLKNENTEQKLQPYLTAGINALVLGGVKEVSDNNYNDNAKMVADRSFTAGINGGAGCLFNITPGFAIKLEGGYTYLANLTLDENIEKDAYHMYTSHAYVTAGIRFRISSE